MKQLLLTGMAMALCACASAPKHSASVTSRPPRPDDCRVEVLPFAPSEGYDELGTVAAHTLPNARERFSEEMRKLGCQRGADAVVYEAAPSRSANGAAELTVRFLARQSTGAEAAAGARNASSQEASAEAAPSFAPPLGMTPSEKAGFLKIRCRLDVRVCSDAAYAYAHGVDTAKDEFLATALYTAVCRAGDKKGCLMAAHLYDQPSLRPYRADAVEVASAACGFGIANGCTRLGVLYGEQGAPWRDDARMVESYERGCKLGDAMGCNDLAWALERGRGTSKDLARAVSLYQQSCDTGLMLGCQNLAVMLTMGRGTRRDVSRASTLFQQVCASGSAPACNALAQLAKDETATSKDPAAAASIFESSCDAGQPSGCVNLGWLYERGDGKPQDVQRAVALYEKGCNAGLAVGCSNAASLLEASNAPAAAEHIKALYRKACDLGLTPICETRAATH